MSKIKTLVLPAGSGMAITAIKALMQDQDITVIAGDIDKLAPGLYLSQKGILLPPFNDNNFFDKVKELVVKERITVIMPALDTILLEFSKRVDEFRQLGVQILVSDPETIRVTRDKWETYLCLKDTILMPKSFIKKQEIDFDFPLFIKPRDGSGSKNTYIIKSKKELDFFYDYLRNPIIQEFLPGTEYTIDCLADMQGKLITCVIRQRLEIRDGISTKALIVHNSELERMSKDLSRKLQFKGPFFFQAKEDRNGKPRLIEVNARIAGTMCHKSFYESNFHCLAVKLSRGKTVSIPRIKYGLYISRHWEEMYLKEDKNNNELLKVIY
jgi:carbamoyl-phosphate synthase large subunit